MKKIVTGIAALTLLLTGCAQSTESLYEEVVDLCEEYFELATSGTGTIYCSEAFLDIANDQERLLIAKQDILDDIKALQNK